MNMYSCISYVSNHVNESFIRKIGHSIYTAPQLIGRAPCRRRPAVHLPFRKNGAMLRESRQISPADVHNSCKTYVSRTLHCCKNGSSVARIKCGKVVGAAAAGSSTNLANLNQPRCSAESVTVLSFSQILCLPNRCCPADGII